MINSKIRNISLAVSSLLIGASHVAFANESEDVERVLVYGALTTTPLSELATSIDVISALDIEQRHAQHLDELFNRSANVNFATGASRGRFVQIRGIGEPPVPPAAAALA
ncbi:MAG: Plug domain-containing protein, partial [Paraglaciecola sp.]|nr:Plug domain-containing protein [Paraglaciecola sp.]